MRIIAFKTSRTRLRKSGSLGGVKQSEKKFWCLLIKQGLGKLPSVLCDVKMADFSIFWGKLPTVLCDVKIADKERFWGKKMRLIKVGVLVIGSSRK